MKKPRKSRLKVVNGEIVSRTPSPVPQNLQARAAEQSVQRSRRCPLCQKTCAEMVEVRIGYVSAHVCLPCGRPVLEAISGAGAIAQLLARFF